MPGDTSLYLDFAIAAASAETAERVLAAALEAGPVASVLIRTEPDMALEASLARKLIDLAQKRGIAALVEADVAQAAKLQADGVHLPWGRDIVRHFKEARQAAKPGTIIGADAGRTRHDAMELGEAGADYVAFGIPPHVEDRARAVERQVDLISWWNELFEVPCVAFDIADAEHARRVAEAGADFVSVPVSSRDTEAEAAQRVSAYSDALLVGERA